MPILLAPAVVTAVTRPIVALTLRAVLADPPAPPVAITPVPLPDPALSDADYKFALYDLLTNPVQRPGVFVSLAGLISRDAPPPHASVIVELLSNYLNSTNTLETVVPLKVLGRCGAVARPAIGKVLTLAASPIAPVRLAVAEALGGMYYAAPGTPPTAPPSVTKILLYMLQSDADRGTKRAAAVALGRCRVATPEVVTSLTAIAGGSDTQLSLGALYGLEQLGPDAKLALAAIKTRLADKDTVANAALALIAVASPQETVDTLAQTLTTTGNFLVRQAIIYYVTQLPKSSADTTALATIIKEKMGPPPPLKSDEKPDYAPEDMFALRVAAANAYQTVTNDTPTTANALSEIIADTTASASVRRGAVAQITKLGKAAIEMPTVAAALQVALADTDSNLQGAIIAILYRYASPTMKPFAPRLSELLLSAWQNKQSARMYSLLNALNRIGPAAKTSAVPVLKKILAGEPKGSSNAQFAKAVLEKMSG